MNRTIANAKEFSNMSSCFTSGSDGIGRSSDLHGTKVQIYFGLSKKNALLLAFFSLEDAASRYCLEAIGWDLPEFDSGIMDKESTNSVRKNANEMYYDNCFRK